MLNHLEIDVFQGPKERTCSGCQEPFQQGEFQVFHLRVWHLDCFKPDFPTKISFERDVELGVRARKYEEKVRSWVEQWNRVDWVETEELSEGYFGNEVRRGRNQRPRMMLEVFKFLGAQEVELRASQACLQWHSVARSQELWVEFFEREFYPGPKISKSIDIRSVFITHTFQACWHCKHLVAAADVHYVCPYYRRPLCVACSDLPECMLVTEFQLRRIAGVTPAQRKALEMPFFQFGVKRCTYLALAWVKLRELRQRRKTWLLQQLEKEQILTLAELARLRALQTNTSSEDRFQPILHFLGILRPISQENLRKRDYLRLKQALRQLPTQTAR